MTTPSKPKRTMPSRTAIIAALPAALAASLALLPAAPAAADYVVPVTPFVDCVRDNHDPANPYTAFFGFNNTGSTQFRFDAGGADNYGYPAFSDFGQPTLFSPGNYPRVGSRTFDNNFITTTSWELNGTTVDASVNSPRCTAGLTSPASDVAGTSATLNGAVTPEGEDVTYHFEYGTSSSSLDKSTPTQDAGSGTVPQLVQTNLSDLTPSTTYFFRIVTTATSAGTTNGETQSFTTPASNTPPAPAPLAVGTTRLPHATYGTAFSQPISASGGTAPYTWSVTAGSLPAGLSLDASTGTISGTPTAAGTAQFTVAATDAATPSHATASQPLSIIVEPAATITHVISSENPAAPGWPVTYTAVVSGSPTAPDGPTGTVTFTDNGAPAVCSGGSRTLDRTGIATCTVFSRGSGAHAIVARYSGDARYTGSASAVLTETVKRIRSFGR